MAPTSFSTCGSFFELTQYCWYATIFHTQNTWVELERLKMCHEVKKSAPAAWSDSYIFLFDQNAVFLGFNQLVRKPAFSWVVRQFSTIFENVMSCHIIVLESNCFQKSLLRQKSAPAAWSDSYIFLFDQNVVFLGFNQLVRKPAFSWVTAQFSTIFENVMSCRITVFELI